MKKIFKITGITILVILVLLIAAPFLFKGKIIKIIKNNVNKNINATFDFADADVSLFRNFPNASVTLDQTSVINKAPFTGDTLFYAGKMNVSMSIKELFKGEGEPLNVDGITVENANVNILVDKNGKANYDIAIPSDKTNNTTDTSSTAGFNLNLKNYSIKNTHIAYIDEGAKIALVLDSLNHSGSGDLSLENSELTTKTTGLTSFTLDSVNYLNKNKVQLDAVIGIDLKHNKYSFLKNQAIVNQLPLVFDGYVQVNENNQDVNINFKTPSSDFKNFLAVIPEVYSKNIENVKTTGNFTVNGKINGIVDDKHIPKLAITVASKNASFKYPDLPKSVDHIHLSAAIKNETGIVEDTYVTIDTLSFKIDQDVFNGRAQIKNLMGNMLVNATVNGQLNLANLSQAYPVPKDLGLSGILDAHVATAFDMRSIENKNYANTKNSGTLNLSGFHYNSEEMANPIAIQQANLKFNPTTVTLNNFQAQTGKTDLSATGSISNFMGFLFNNEGLEGNFDLNSNTFNVDDFMVASSIEKPAAEKKAGAPVVKENPQIKIPSFLDCTINAKANTVLYDDLTLKNVQGKLIVKDEKATLQNLRSDIFNGQVALNGSVSTKETTPKFDMALDVANFDIASSFEQLDMLQALAPIAKVLQGKLNTNLKLAGSLDNHLSPILLSLSGDALAQLLTKDVLPQNSKLLDALNGKLDFIDLKNINLSDLKTHLTFTDGQVNVKPFTIKYKDIAIDIVGSHKFDKTMDYNLTFDIPAKYLGSDVNNLITKLNGSAATQTTIVPVKVNLGGTFNSPTVTSDLKSAVTNLTQQLVAQQKQKLVNQGKEKVQDALTDILKGNTKKDSTVTKQDSTKAASNQAVKEAAKNILNGLFNKKKKDTTGAKQ
ncbi:AsmA-like C-terminal region-containing protein [Zhouia sp. PK063]|uniref:AsmA-like C-terminal region-containing protein n=1 Tax=Zhouia sp. PK063 TaxID=3373602 RepID=UPI00379DF9A9